MYRIADVNVQMPIESETLREKFRGYVCPAGKADISVLLDNALLEKIQKKNPGLSREDCEYMLCGYAFNRKLIHFDAFMLHASAVAYENRAYLFSAPSGTGKSTHTALWQKHFGAEKAQIINDDKPVLRQMGKQIIVYGTPFSGKSDLNINIGVPLGGICFIKRGEQNRIRPLRKVEAVKCILDQTIRPDDEQSLNRLMDLIETVIEKVRIFEMACTMDESAAETAYRMMK